MNCNSCYKPFRKSQGANDHVCRCLLGPQFDPAFALLGVEPDYYPSAPTEKAFWLEPDGRRTPADSTPPARDTVPCPAPGRGTS